MTRMFIVVGDATTGGGRVLTGSPFTDINGLPVARVGDKASCPQHKGVFSIAGGDPSIIIDGKSVARHGDKLACGCSLIGGRQQQAYMEEGGQAGAGMAAASAAAVAVRPVVAPVGRTGNTGPGYATAHAGHACRRHPARRRVL